MAAGLHISINAEKLFDLGGVPISNSILTTWIVTILIFLIASKTYKAFAHTKFNKKPTRFQSLMEMIIESLYNLVKSTAGTNKKARVIFPIVSTFFLFIIISNWIGLLPGVGTIGFLESHETTEVHAQDVDTHADDISASEVADDTHATEVVPAITDTHGQEVETIDQEEVVAMENEETHEAEESGHAATSFVPYFRGPTADLNTTLALAIFSMVTVQIIGFKFLGFNYTTKFINLKGPIDFFVGFLELFSEISKIISFAFRLFGNIFAGEVLLAVIAFLMPLIAPLPFLGLEIFVGFIQALVFSMLTLVFANIATLGHAEEH